MTETTSISTISSLPTEIIHEIILCLPISPDLMSFGLTCARFARITFQDVILAETHVKRMVTACTVPNCLWTFLDSVGIKYDGWKCLPFAYKAAVYGEILIAEAWPLQPQMHGWKHKDIDLMWYERWKLTQDSMVSIIETLLQRPSYRISSRALAFAILHGYPLVVDLILTHETFDFSRPIESVLVLAVTQAMGSTRILEKLLQDSRIDSYIHRELMLRYAQKYNDSRAIELLEATFGRVLL